VAPDALLVDTGPLVALISERDAYHFICTEEAKSLQWPFYSCWPVITEATHLLKTQTDAVQKLLNWIRSSEIQILQLSISDVDRISGILKRYSDQSFDFADAALMHLAERENMQKVFTIDHRHFSVYRTRKRKRLSIVPATLRP
jgi:predicted nucleic acid-binding protein